MHLDQTWFKRFDVVGGPLQQRALILNSRESGRLSTASGTMDRTRTQANFWQASESTFPLMLEEQQSYNLSRPRQLDSSRWPREPKDVGKQATIGGGFKIPVKRP